MTWSKFDDAAAIGPKAAAAGNEAWGLWTAAVMYSNRHLTDGFVTIEALSTKCLPASISEKKASQLAEKLVSAIVRPGGFGLFERVEGGYLIHHFHQWNPTKEEVEAKRELDRARKKRVVNTPEIPRGFQADSKRNPNGIQAESARIPEPMRASARAPARAARPDPSRPVPTRPASGADSAAAAATNELPAEFEGSIADRAQKVLDNPLDGRFSRPSTWPGVRLVAEAWFSAFGIQAKRLRDDISRDSDLKAILEALAAGDSPEDLAALGPIAAADEFCQNMRAKGPICFSAAVIRRLQSVANPAPIAPRVAPKKPWQPPPLPASDPNPPPPLDLGPEPPKRRLIGGSE